MAQKQPSSSGGYDISASLSGSSSAGASNSGATDQGGGYYNFGTAYGPGGFVLTDQRGSIGASAAAGSGSLILVVIVIAAASLFIFRKR